MIVVDSSVFIDYFRGVSTDAAGRFDRLLGVERLATGDLMLAEVLQGFDTDRDFRTALRLMNSLAIVHIGGRELALQAAQNFRTLRKRGITVRKTIDTLIATRCIASHYTLLYSDRDFDPFVEHLGLLPAVG